MKLLILITASAFLFSCTTKKSSTNEALLTDSETTTEDSTLLENPDFEVNQDFITETETETEPTLKPEEEAVVQIDATEQMDYTVESGDTFMLVAFKIYGDYTKWKEIHAANPSISASSDLKAGTVIKYPAVTEKFTWEPQGLPHLIKSGETLGTISQSKYGTTSKWKGIWDNNRPLIKDPNKIFAGFTLYYIPEETRDVASDSLIEEPIGL